MWALLETLIYYFHRKHLVVPVALLGIVIGVYFIVSSFCPDRIPLDEPKRSSVEVIDSGSNIKELRELKPLVYERVKLHVEKPIVTEIDNQQDEVNSNKESIHNFTKFDELLYTSLNEKYGEVFSRNLSYKISQNLREGKTEMETLDTTIMEELGPDASDEERREIRNLITESLAKISPT